MILLSELDDDVRYNNVRMALGPVCLVFSGTLDLGGTSRYFGGNLTTYVKNGTIPSRMARGDLQLDFA